MQGGRAPGRPGHGWTRLRPGPAASGPGVPAAGALTPGHTARTGRADLTPLVLAPHLDVRLEVPVR
ncbi:hypothetical protein ABZT34_42420, partial [Streptomyces sp. NPDC005329]